MSAVAASPISVSGARRSYGELAAITLGHALTHWYPATFYILLPLIGRELGLSYGEIGSIITAQAVAGAISNVPGGVIVDSIGRKGALMALSLFWIGFPYLVMGFSHAYWMLLVCATLIGVGNNLWHPTAIPTLAQRYPDKKGLVVSIHGMGGNVGDALAPFAAGVLLQTLSWRDVMIVNVVPGVLMSAFILIYLGRLRTETSADAPRKDVRATVRALAPLMRNRTLAMLSVSSAFRAMTQTSLLAFLPLYLANAMHYSYSAVGACMLGFQAAGFLAAPIAGAMSDRVGRRAIIASSMAMTGVVLLAMIVAGQSFAFVLLVATLGFFLFAVRR